MNQAPQTSLSDILTEEVLASHFTLIETPGELELITVDGASGWTSPNPHPVLSLLRWTTSDQDAAAVALGEALAFFQDKLCGFDWMTGPKTGHLAPLLYERGFLKHPLEVAAMTSTFSSSITEPQLDGLQILKVEDVTDPRISSVMAKGFDVPDDVGLIYHNAYVTPSDLQKTDVYAAYEAGSDTPVAVGYLSYIGAERDVLLRVSSTLESHRGRGLYRAMVLHRLREAAHAGRSQAFVQSYSPSSKNALADLGFKQAGVLHLHRWRT